MRIARRFAAVLAALSVCLTVTVANAFELTETAVPVDQAAHVIYDPGNGNVSFLSPNDALTSLQIESATSAYSDWSWAKENPFDVQSEAKQSVFNFDGFASAEAFDLGNILAPGLTASEIIADTNADGSRLAGGKVNTSPGGGPYLLVVPEPSSIALVFCGLLGLLGLRRK